MGFSLKKMFSGSGWKKFKKTVGGVAKIGLSVIPGVGGLAGKAAGALLGAKAVKSVGGLVDKIGKVDKLANLSKNGRSTAMVLKMSPVMPGGSYATPYGVAPAPDSGNYPMQYAGGVLAGQPRKPRRRKKATKPRARPKKRTTTSRRTTKGRLPKFGSPAWRKRFGLDTKRKSKKRSA